MLDTPLSDLIAEAKTTFKSQRGQRKHNPFKRKSVLGVGPRGRTNKQTKDWKCRCNDYVCKCLGASPATRGRRKFVKIDPSYKSAYNAEYKAWVARKGTLD